MTKASIKRDRRRKSSAVSRILKWTLAVAVVALLAYVVFQSPAVAFDEDDIRVVSFSRLSPAEKQSALQTANRERCTCGCGMNLAQCVATDMTCPVRERNIESIRKIVQAADQL